MEMKIVISLFLAAGLLVIGVGCANDSTMSPQGDRIGGSAGVNVLSRDMSRVSPEHASPGAAGKLSDCRRPAIGVEHPPHFVPPMKSKLLLFVLAGFGFTPLHAALDQSLQALAAVGREGQGNEAANAAWKRSRSEWSPLACPRFWR